MPIIKTQIRTIRRQQYPPDMLRSPCPLVGQSVAVQNFHEILASLVLLAVHGGLTQAKVPLHLCIARFCIFIALAVVLLMSKQRINQRRGPVYFSAEWH